MTASTTPRTTPADVYRRRRLTVGAALLAIVVGVVAVVRSTQGIPHHASSPASAPTSTAGPRPASPPHLVVSRTPWILPSPVARAAVFAEDGRLAVLGGLGPTNTTTSAIVEVDMTTGQGTTIGRLAVPVHDAASATLGSHLFVFGGGAESVSSAVQMFNPNGATTSPLRNQVAGRLCVGRMTTAMSYFLPSATPPSSVRGAPVPRVECPPRPKNS